MSGVILGYGNLKVESPDLGFKIECDEIIVSGKLITFLKNNIQMIAEPFAYFETEVWEIERIYLNPENEREQGYRLSRRIKNDPQ